MGLILMIIYSANHGTAVHVISSVIFGASMFFLYFSSGLMHWLPVGKAKVVFRKFDQIGIFLLIAGTYTPFAMIAIKGTMGWVILGIEWLAAFIGIIIRIIQKEDMNKNVSFFYIAIYMIMGWVIIIDINHLLEVLSSTALWLLLSGGVFYSVGVIFFRMHKLKYHHLIWHFFVLLGTLMHFIAIYFHVLPLK